MNEEVRVRFAPSPTGLIHIGNLRTAIFNYLFAKHNKGKFFLRIEDTDFERSTLEYENIIKDVMEWMNTEYESLVLRQSERIKIYQTIAINLYNNKKAYYCKCVFVEEENRDYNVPQKICTCYHENYTEGVLRYKVPENNRITFNDMILQKEITVDTNTIENFALLRSNGLPTYNLAVVVDDIELNITHVLRGNEHIYNTPKQILLYQEFNKIHPQFGHFPMIFGKDGKKLSKRNGSVSVVDYKNAGFLPEALFNFLIRLGWGYKDQEIFSKEEAIQLFDVKKISKSSAIFNEEKLKYLGNYYLKNNYKYYLDLIIENFNSLHNKDLFLEILEEFSKRYSTINELKNNILFIFQPINLSEINIKFLRENYNTLLSLINKLKSVEWKEEILQKDLISLNKENNCLHLLRIALTNQQISPPLWKVLMYMGKEEIIRRLEKYL